MADKYLKKGARIYIEGKLRNRQIESNDGNKKTITEIEAENLVMLDRRQDSNPKSNYNDDYSSGSNVSSSSPNFEDLDNTDIENTNLPF